MLGRVVPVFVVVFVIVAAGVAAGGLGHSGTATESVRQVDCKASGTGGQPTGLSGGQPQVAGPQSNVTEVWNTTMSTRSSFVVDNRTVYLTTTGELFALDADDGEALWGSPLSIRDKTTPAVRNEMVYVGNGDRGLYALSASGGSVEWQFLPSDELAVYTPLVANGTIYFIGAKHSYAKKGGVYALNAETGRQQWHIPWELGTSGRATEIYDGTVYFTFNSGVRAIDADTGEILWNYTRNGYSPYVVKATDSQVFVKTMDGDGNSKIRGLNRSGIQQWSTDTGKWSTFPAVVGDKLYVGSGKNIYVVNTTRQERVRVFETEIGNIQSITATQNRVYATSAGGETLIMDADTGEAIGIYDINGRSFSLLTVTENSLYLTGEKGGSERIYRLSNCEEVSPNNSTETDRPGNSTTSQPSASRVDGDTSAASGPGFGFLAVFLAMVVLGCLRYAIETRCER